MKQEIECREFEFRIHDLLDQRKPLINDSTLQSHASGCFCCAQLLQDFLDFENCFQAPEIRRAKSDEARTLKLRRLIVSITIAASLLLGFGFAANYRVNEFGTTATAHYIRLFNQVEAVGPESMYEPMQVRKPISLAESQVQQKAKTTLATWEIISERLMPLNSYYEISAELPGIRPLRSSLGLTIDWFRQTFFRFAAPKRTPPGLGLVDSNLRCLA